MRKMKSICQYFPILLLFLVFFSCKKENRVEEEIAKIPMNVAVSRFDSEFANAKPQDLPRLKRNYPYLFPAQFSDSVWLSKMTDTLQNELQVEVAVAFPDLDHEKKGLRSLFRHFKYYVPQFNPPKVVTLVSEVRYDQRVIFMDSLLLIGLDNYLGTDHKFYAGLPNYVSKSLDDDFLISDVASSLAKTINQYPRDRTLLGRMVYHGKELYIKDKLTPTLNDAQKIGYTQEEIDWARANEEQIWRYFVENELLYNTDAMLDQRFLDPAPFSKFGLELDSESPARLGRYVGWQIVRAFVEKSPEVELRELLLLPADEIFQKSNYKPKR